MRRYWWVNHKQTHAQEIAGEFLWSPKTNSTGGENQFYKNMRIAVPGDFVLSFANSQVAYWGKVTDFAFTSAKPSEFGKAGEAWGAEGWLLPVQWSKLRSAVTPKRFISELGPLLPNKYSPIGQVSGNGHQGAYLAEIGLPAFQKVLEKSGIDLDLVFSTEEAAVIFGTYAEGLDDAIERQLEIATDLSSTEKSQLIKARRGQGLFRANVQKIETECRLTGVDNQQFLIASHIKPWRSCQTPSERLDGNNGLLLTPHVDLLFDQGFISFEDSGALIVSPMMSQADMNRLGLASPPQTRWKEFMGMQRQYLAYHRLNVLKTPV